MKYNITKNYEHFGTIFMEQYNISSLTFRMLLYSKAFKKYLQEMSTYKKKKQH